MSLTEMGRLAPGLICDLYIMRRRYDDEQHRIKRKRRARYED